MTTLAEELATFVAGLRYDELPAAVVERLQLHVLDLVGVCVLGARMPFADMLVATVAQSGGIPESTLPGRGGARAPAPLAALFIGGIAHGNEFDDTYSAGRWHGSAGTVPAMLAVAESLGADGRSFVAALAGALEAGCRLTRAAPRMITRGFHSTATTGIFSSTLGAGRLMGLDAGRLADCLGISGGFASGTGEFLSDPEAWPKRIQVGYAAHGAVLAARAASHGFKGPHTILEGRHGYFRAYAGEGNFDLGAVTEGLGSHWELLRLYAKRYPCDHIAQGYLDCAIGIARAASLDVADVERVETIVHPLARPVMFEPRELRYAPDNGWSARWSMPFNVAVALADRAVTIDSYTDERARHVATRSLMAKVVAVEDASLAFPADYPAWIRVHLRDGRVLERRQPHVAGSPQNPMPAAEYERKFVDNASRTLAAAKVRELLARLRDLAGQKSMAGIAALYA